MNKESKRKYYSFKKVLRELKLNEERLKEIVSKGDLKAYRDNNEIKFDQKDVQRYKTQIQQRSKLTQPTGKGEATEEDPGKVSQIIEDEHLFDTMDKSFDSVFYTPSTSVREQEKEGMPESSENTENEPEDEDFPDSLPEDIEENGDQEPESLAEQLESNELLDEPEEFEEDEEFLDMDESFVEHYDKEDEEDDDEEKEKHDPVEKNAFKEGESQEPPKVEVEISDALKKKVKEAAKKADSEISDSLPKKSKDSIKKPGLEKVTESIKKKSKDSVKKEVKTEIKDEEEALAYPEGMGKPKIKDTKEENSADDLEEELTPAKKTILVVVIAIIIAFILYVSLKPSGDKELTHVITSQITQGDIVTKVIADGVVTACNSELVIPQIPGKVVKIFVKENTPVTKDETWLINMESEDLKDRISQAEMNLERSKELLNQSKIELDDAQRELKLVPVKNNAETKRQNSEREQIKSELRIRQGELNKITKDLKRAEEELENKKYLLAQNLITKADFQDFNKKIEDLKIEEKNAQERIKQTESRLDTISSTVSDELARFQNKVSLAESAYKLRDLEVKQAEAKLEIAKAEKEKLWIKAPITGVVTRINVKVDEPVAPNSGATPDTALMVIEDFSQFFVEANISQTDISKVTKLQLAYVSFTSFPGEVFKGRVKSVSETAYSPPDGRGPYFKAIISLEEKPAFLKPGFTAEIEIVTSTIQNTLCIPLEAVVSGSEDGKEEKVYRVVEHEGKASVKEIKIELGESNDLVAAVKKGLSKGDRIVIGPARVFTHLRDGMQVEIASEK